MSLARRKQISGGTLALLLALATTSFAQTTGRNAVMIRGQQQDVYFYPASASAWLNRKVLFLPGDGGWRGWAITIAQQMASWGYDVYGLDTKTYLTSFTGKTTLKETEVMSDLRQVTQWITKGTTERVTLLGWSEGAGLATLGGDVAHQAGRRVAEIGTHACVLSIAWRLAIAADLSGAGLLAGDVGGRLALFVLDWRSGLSHRPLRYGSAECPRQCRRVSIFTVVGLALFGVDKATATAFSLVVFTVLTLPLLLLGFAAISTSGTSLGQLRRAAQRSAHVR